MLRFSFYALLLGFVLTLAAAGGVWWWVAPQLPSTETLRDVRLQTPLKIYTSNGALLGEFGEQRRTPVAINAVPDLVKQAFIAAEDDRFYEHPGVDWIAIARAALGLLQTHEKKQGGSTITMQVARNFFLTPEKTYTRKLKEIMLALKIEHDLSKDEILELYLNKIFLGQRAYGVGAAAQVYFGTSLTDLTLPQIATIAALPKAPSKVNPITNPAAAKERRGYVLSRMLKLGYIDQQAFTAAMAAPLDATLHGLQAEVDAPYLAEMVRAYMQEHYGDAAYTDGYRVFTTITNGAQAAAVTALQTGLLQYDRRHGYRGPEGHVDLNAATVAEAALQPYSQIGGLVPALVTAVGEHDAVVLDPSGTSITLTWEGLSWARKYISVDQLGPSPKRVADILKVGDIVRIQWADVPAKAGQAPASGFWRLEQIPVVEGALVSLDSHDGAILSLVGGFDFEKTKFNRAIQAMRQPGSNFKPFLYSAALDHGFTAASFINDAPIVYDAPGLENAWRPENYTRNYNGPTRLREALANSRNLVSIRLMKAIGIDAVIDHVSRFGFSSDRLPRNLSLALGTGTATPLQLATGYAAFSNGGFRIEPYFIKRIEAGDGQVVMEAAPLVACNECSTAPVADEEPADLAALIAQRQEAPPRAAPRAIDEQNAWIMYSMLKDVITRGTGRRAIELGRSDLAGKTGTTNEQKDAWFSGFNGRIVTTTWIGFDQSEPLGKPETGARAALPIWIDYMRTVLKDTPAAEMERPAGLVTIRIDPTTGLLASAGNTRAIFETFRESDVPKLSATSGASYAPEESRSQATEQLF